MSCDWEEGLKGCGRWEIKYNYSPRGQVCVLQSLSNKYCNSVSVWVHQNLFISKLGGTKGMEEENYQLL